MVNLELVVQAFGAGLAMPLFAACVLPLYPGFIAYLTNQVTGGGQKEVGKKPFIIMGLLVFLGVLLFMTILGIVFSLILGAALTDVVQVISPIAFFILLVVSIMMIMNKDIGKYLPKAKAKVTGNPYKTALLYGVFFGAIVIPCNPGFVAWVFALVALDPSNFLIFLAFGTGIGLPLLILAVASAAAGQALIDFLTKYKKSG